MQMHDCLIWTMVVLHRIMLKWKGDALDHRLQEDVVMGTLTVRENLRFSAALRLPSSVPQSEKEARVNQLIKELGLTSVADSKVRLHTCVRTSASFFCFSLKMYFSREDERNPI